MSFRLRVRCYVCNKQCPPNQTVRITGLGEENQQIMATRRETNNLPPAIVDGETRVCFNCNNSVTQEINLLEADPSCLRLNVVMQRHNHACIVCGAPAGDLLLISNPCRAHVFIERNIYIPDSLHACQDHFDEENFLTEEVLNNIRFINRPILLKGNELGAFLEAMRLIALGNKGISEASLNAEDFKIVAAITKEQFEDLYLYCDDVIDEQSNKHRKVKRIDLLTFLCKMRQGLSDNFLKILFGYSSRSAVSMVIQTVRKSLMQRFVRANIGFGAITREEYINQHVSDFANELYNPEPANKVAIAYFDATYVYMPKSSNFSVLRKTFNLHKHRHLIKPVVVVADDGYFLDIHGPYFSNASNNDAAILNQKLNDYADEIRGWFLSDDIFVIDRGYRDSIGLLERLGIVHKMPSLLPRGQKQFTTEEANESRLVTKTRWIVEARNGHLKTIFKFLDGVVPIVHLPNIGDFYRIAGAIINRYRPLIHMQGADIELARECLRRSRMPNLLQQRVEREELHRRNARRWQQLTANLVNDFPELSIDYLKNLTVGVYQLKLAPSYVQDKVIREETDPETDDVYQIELLLGVDRIPEPGLIRIRVFSRFRQAGKHQLWIHYSPTNRYSPTNESNDENATEPIQGYYCTCISGARTLGTCAHVTSVLWYLGYALNEDNPNYPPTELETAILDCNRQQNPDNHDAD